MVGGRWGAGTPPSPPTVCRARVLTPAGSAPSNPLNPYMAAAVGKRRRPKQGEVKCSRSSQVGAQRDLQFEPRELEIRA